MMVSFGQQSGNAKIGHCQLRDAVGAFTPATDREVFAGSIAFIYDRVSTLK
jgi:hypothetical protein